MTKEDIAKRCYSKKMFVEFDLVSLQFILMFYIHITLFIKDSIYNISVII